MKKIQNKWYWYHSVWMILLVCVFLIEGFLFLQRLGYVDKEKVLTRLNSFRNSAASIQSPSKNISATKSVSETSDVPAAASKEAILLRKPKTCYGAPHPTNTPYFLQPAPVDTTSFDTKNSYNTYRFVVNHVGVPVYEIDIPDGWIAYTELHTNSNTVHFGKARNIYEGARTNSYSEITIKFYYDPELAAIDPLEWDREAAGYLFDGVLPPKWVDTTVNGIPAERGIVEGHGSSDTVYFTKNNILFTASNSSADTAIFNRMLSTFKLLDTDIQVIATIPPKTHIMNNKISWDSQHLHVEASNFYLSKGKKDYTGGVKKFEVTSKKMLDNETRKVLYLMEVTWCEDAEPIGLYMKAMVSPKNKTWSISGFETRMGNDNNYKISYTSIEGYQPTNIPIFTDKATYQSDFDRDDSMINFEDLVVAIKE